MNQTAIKQQDESAQRQWANRGWWLAIDIERRMRTDDNYQTALKLMQKGESYCLILENGSILRRSIFRKDADFSGVNLLIQLVASWKGTQIHLNGREVTPDGIRLLLEQLRCAAAGRGGCLHTDRLADLTFIGCGLPGFGVRLIRPNRRNKKQGLYWYHFFGQDPERRLVFNLDRERLKNHFQVADGCPHFDRANLAICDHLPGKINISNSTNRGVWSSVSVADKKNGRRKVLVPTQTYQYEYWLEHMMDEIYSQRRSA